MKLFLISLLLVGCNQKLEKPKQFYEEIKDAKPQNIVKKQKNIDIPSEWKKHITVNFAENTSIINMIQRLATQHQINLRLSSDLTDSKTFFSCKDTPLLEVIKKLCTVADFKITIEGNEIYIEQDEEHEHIHEITFLSNIRTANTQTNLNPSSENGGLNIGSSVTVNNDHTSDLWKEIKQNLDFILKSRDQHPHYTLNKQAGMLIVRGTQKQQKKIYAFLKQIHKRAASQVLIETKVLSVRLNHSFKTGINWSSLNLYRTLPKIPGTAQIDVNSEIKNNNALKVLISENGNTHEVISFLENYGEVSTLSNPTTTVLNNQYAIFKVAENQVYFKLTKELITSQGIDQKINIVPIFGSEVKEVLVGTILSVQPSIDFRNRTITLFLHPTISDISHTVDDPAVTLMSDNNTAVKSSVPVISTQEMDSTIRVDDGNLVIVGGLIKKSKKQEKRGLPGVRKIPILGQTSNDSVHEETVIMLRAYILDAPENHCITSTKDYELCELK